jgi:hypothetical protein
MRIIITDAPLGMTGVGDFILTFGDLLIGLGIVLLAVGLVWGWRALASLP